MTHQCSLRSPTLIERRTLVLYWNSFMAVCGMSGCNCDGRPPATLTGVMVSQAYRHVFCGNTYALYNGSRVTAAHDCPANAEPPCVWGRDSVCGSAMFAGHHQRWAQLLWVLSEIAFWFGVAGYLHHVRWYWAL
eukprot:m.172117 g.172117  ORF g.172117 m.172117 type:complete len:134 (-) comp18282_c0_seq57:2178-2579(-)